MITQDFLCARKECGGRVSRLLAGDEPGEHTYVFACRSCHREYGGEWVVQHWGKSEPVPPIDLQPWRRVRPTSLAVPHVGLPCTA